MDEHKNNQSRIISIGILLVLVGLIVYVIVTTKGTGAEKANQKSGEIAPVTAQKENKKVPTDVVTGVLKKINEETKTITVYRIEERQDELFSYSGGTDVKDEFGQITTMNQLDLGEIVDLYGTETGDTISALKISEEAWEYTGVNRKKITKTDRILRIAETNYQYDEDLVIFSGEKQIPYMELTDQDEITIKGIDKNIYSFNLTKGHGYIRFTNYKPFYGGMVEVGRGIIMPISEDMLITAKEGSYNVNMEKGTLIGSQTIEVLRDEEIMVDMKDFKEEAKEVGKVTFYLSPNGATLKVDGSEVDYDVPVTLSFGKHSVEARLDGYTTYTNILKVTKEKMTLKIKLLDADAAKEEVKPTSTPDKSNESTNETTDQGGYNNTADETDNQTKTNDVKDDTSKEEGTPAPSATNTPEPTEPTDPPEIDTTLEHTVIVADPEGAEVYLDGVKKGIAPVEFVAKGGSHIVTFYRSGYDTKSYPIDITQSMSFSLPDMVKSK